MTDAERVLEIAAQLMAGRMLRTLVESPEARAKASLQDAEVLIREWRTRTAPPEPQDTELATLRARVEELEKARCRHGWRGATPEHTSSIATPCPTCGLKSLFVASGGHLTCANLSCKEPSPESAWEAARASAETERGTK